MNEQQQNIRKWRERSLHKLLILLFTFCPVQKVSFIMSHNKFSVSLPSLCAFFFLFYIHSFFSFSCSFTQDFKDLKREYSAVGEENFSSFISVSFCTKKMLIPLGHQIPVFSVDTLNVAFFLISLVQHLYFPFYPMHVF